MEALIIFNLVLLLIIAALLLLVKKTVKSSRAEQTMLLLSAIVTIIFHYSTFIYRLITGNAAIEYLRSNPNLILPIYPCNVVMWSCLIIGLVKERESKLVRLLTDS